jgi:hypothetical protein
MVEGMSLSTDTELPASATLPDTKPPASAALPEPACPPSRARAKKQSSGIRHYRWWFPRGTELSGIGPEHADYVAGIINNHRRRSLGYQSPAELFDAFIMQ